MTVVEFGRALAWLGIASVDVRLSAPERDASRRVYTLTGYRGDQEIVERAETLDEAAIRFLNMAAAKPI